MTMTMTQSAGVVVAVAGLTTLLLAPSFVSSASIEPSFTPYGFQSGNFNVNGSSASSRTSSTELLNDDTYASSMYYDPQHNLVYLTGLTYGTYFDSIFDSITGGDDDDPPLTDEVRGAMGMSSEPGGRDSNMPHLVSGDCFLAILKLPQLASTASNSNNNDNSPLTLNGGMSNPAPWLVHVDENDKSGGKQQKLPKLIYARRFGTPQNSEACSSILMLPKVNDALLQTSAQLKLALLGHVNPAPMSSADANAMGPGPGPSIVSVRGEGDEDHEDNNNGDDQDGSGRHHRRTRRLEQREENNPNSESGVGGHGGDHGGGGVHSSKSNPPKRNKQNQSNRKTSSANGGNNNRGGFLHSISDNGPITEGGRAYGFVADFDLSLTVDAEFTATSMSVDPSVGATFNNAYGALLGGHVLESSPVIYPVAMTQNKRDPNQIYVVSMHSDNAEAVVNPEYGASTREELDGSLHRRPDLTLGGAGGRMSGGGSSRGPLLSGGGGGGVPKFGTDFYVKVQQLLITPNEDLMDVEPTYDEQVKRTMTSGWGFGFKLNEANDVRPSSVVFIKGRTPNEDLLLLGGTTRRGNDADDGGEGELDGFITKIVPPAPSPVADRTTGSSVEDAMEDESIHPTKRIESTTGRDETVTAICLPPPDIEGVTAHAFVVGSTASLEPGSNPSMAYILKMRLDDLSTVWKEHVPSIHPSGLGGDVLGEGCAVSPDGELVYLSGTVDGGSALNTGMRGMETRPVGGASDVFVVAFDDDFGNVQWAKQFGTVREDTLARGGGIECDNEGNVIVVGSTRGGLQRFRSDATPGDRRGRGLQGQGQALPQTSGGRMASDVFVMSLSRADGDHVNAPFVGGGVALGASGGSNDAASSTAPATVDPVHNSGGGMSPLGKAGISLVVIGIVAALSFLAVRGLRRKSRKRYDADERMWENDGGENFSYDRRGGQFGGRRVSAPLCGVGGASGDEDWDDGTERISKNATWMDNDDDSSVRSIGSSSSRGSRSKKKNSDFLASMRREAASTMTKMVKDNDSGGKSNTTSDPRLDGGASIKSLLTHYREVRKDTLIYSNSDENSSTEGDNNDKSKKGRSGKKKGKGMRSPPPPPPPRTKKKDQAAATATTEPDGLADFTIV